MGAPILRRIEALELLAKERNGVCDCHTREGKPPGVIVLKKWELLGISAQEALERSWNDEELPLDRMPTIAPCAVHGDPLVVVIRF